MSDESEIYEHGADLYEALVSHEDADGNLLPAISSLLPLDGIDVIEIGAGTGRLTVPLARIASVRAFDNAPAMLAVARQKLKNAGVSGWTLLEGDNAAIAAETSSADLVVAGWTVCYAYVDHPGDETGSLDRVLSECRRVLRPGGTIVLLENMGTASETPRPPTHLLPYFADLRRRGFAEQIIRTDFEFGDIETADRLCRAFFGDALADKIDASRVPECTVMWSLRVADPEASPG